MTDNWLDQYKPKLPDLLKDFTLDDEMPKEEYAFKTYKMLLLAKRSSEAMFLVIGKLLKEIRDKQLYETLDYESFNQFLNSEEIGYSRESAYLFIRSYEYLIEHLGLNPEAVGKMNIGRINMLIPILKKIEADEGKEEAIRQIESYDALRHGDFVQRVNEARKTTKPSVWWSEELKKWMVSYYEDTTILQSKGMSVVEGEIL